MATSRIADAVGRVLGDRYRLTRPLGVGASAHVFAAEDVRLKRRVAVKVLHPALATEEAFLRRFRREAQAVAGLRHPNILRVYDWGDDGGAPYLVMELLDGGSLRSMLDRGARLSPAQAAAVGADAARALDYAHRQGLVHRDIKPANLLFDDEGRVSVADFGLARALAEASFTEPTGAVVGTARYVSPELVRGEQLDAKADVYSLALVLVEAMTGTVPFATDTSLGTLVARIGRSVEAPDEVGPLKDVLEAAGQADPADRIDAGAMARGLDAVSVKLPFPAPLSLGGPLESGLVERDGFSPTELPGRRKPFDQTEWEDEPIPAVGAGAGVRLPAVAAPAGEVEPTGHSVLSGEVAASGDVVPPTGAGPTDTRAPTARDVAAVLETFGPDRGHLETEEGRRRRGLRIAALIALVVLLGGGAGLGWALASGRFTPEETVPSLVGDTQSQAAAALAAHHLGLTVSGSQYSSDKSKGQVLSQSPLSGRLKKGAHVRVVLSQGPQPVAVPQLRNQNLQTAEGILLGRGLKWTITQASDMTVRAGSVISSSPDSGTLLPGQSVTIVESSGKPKVAIPPITLNAEPYTQAEAALKTAGFVPTETLQYNDTVKAGDVISVNPPSGTPTTMGSPVAVTVSKGPHYVSVPSTAGDSVGQAAQTLSNYGLQVGGVHGSPLNTVTGTSPGAGTQVLYGSSVEIDTN
ncbi:MAG TPA: PASTA domain-containing protein [Acidimicrobiales bacterium]|nr:PASTA domain-containing protein [Acidimicrobiales bacterium]